MGSRWRFIRLFLGAGPFGDSGFPSPSTNLGCSPASKVVGLESTDMAAAKWGCLPFSRFGRAKRQGERRIFCVKGKCRRARLEANHLYI
jgi:hypothetical protein